MSISEEEHQKRLELYNKGLNDREIGEKVGLTGHAIYSWRKKNNLKANGNGGRKLIKNQKAKKILNLYEKGFNDREIAEKTNLTSSAIHYWRKRNDLTVNHKNKISKRKQKRILELYNQGLNDRQISERVSISQKNVFEWRKENNLSTNYKYKADKKEKEKMSELYNQGLSDLQIAERVGISKKSVYYWRKHNDLSPN